MREESHGGRVLPRIGGIGAAGAIVLVGLLGVVELQSGIASAYTPHAPILIVGNSGFTAGNGVTGGSGTPSDPYIIEGWEIDASSLTGIAIWNTDAHFIIRDVYVHSGGSRWDGISINYAFTGTVMNATVTGNANGISSLYWANATVSGNNASANVGYGISLGYSSNASVSGNVLTANGNGITVYNYADAFVAYNEVSGSAGSGIFFDRAANVSVMANNVSDNGVGVTVTSSTAISVANNTLSGNERGISLASSPSVSVTGNDISLSSWWGIVLHDIAGVYVAANTFTDDGIALWGTALPHFDSHIITPDNLVNGKPLYYHKNCAGLVVDGIPVGQLIVANCTGVTVSNLQIAGSDGAINLAFVNGATLTSNAVSNNGVDGGILLRWSTNVTISENDVRGNRGGIISLDSTAVSVSNNTVISNGDYGIVVDMSAIFPIDFFITNNTVSSHLSSGINLYDVMGVFVNGNTVSGNFEGIHLEGFTTEVSIQNNTITSSTAWAVSTTGSSFITIASNRVSNNGGSVSLASSLNASVYHNDFIANPAGPYDSWSNSENRWDDGYPSGGNYWSDYAGGDNCSGPNQNVCPDPDGIGDTPYVIDADSADRYPLMAPRVDVSPPTISISYPAEGQTLQTPPVTVTGTAFDAGGLDHVEVRVNGGPWQTAAGAAAWSLSVDLRVGANLIEARAWDDTGNPSPSASVNVTYTPNTPQTAAFPMWLPLMLVIVLMALVPVAVLWRRKRNPPKMKPPRSSLR